MSKKVGKRKPVRSRTPAQQAKGLGKGGIAPPEEHQFKPGESGNPAGSPNGHQPQGT